MDFQGWMRDVDGHGGQVVFSFGGQVYTVHLPAVEDEPDSATARSFVREEGTTVLQCFTSRAALELQQALDACGAAGPARLDVPPIQLHGSFADLARQLQECVPAAREEEEWLDMSTGLLNAAVKLGHLSAAQQLMLIDLEAAISQPSAVNHPAHLAAMQPDGAAALKLLLAAAPELLHSTCQHEHSFADHELDGWTLLHGAASSGNVEALRLLLQLAPQLASASTDSNEFPLHQAAAGPSPEAVQLLLQAAPEAAAAADVDGWLPAHFAASAGRAGNLRVLLDAGVPWPDAPAADGRLPLHVAAACSREEDSKAAAVGVLLAAHPAAAAVADHAGNMPLHHAAMANNEAAVRLLLDADPAAASTANSDVHLPLHLAALEHSEAVVHLLLAAHPAAAQAADSLGRIPLHHAAQVGSEATVTLLLAAHPAGALVPDSQGRRPLQLALHHHCYQAVRPLLHVSGISVAELLDAFESAPAYLMHATEPLYANLAARSRLTPAQWQRVPSPCRGLGSALPAVLARSEVEAALLVSHLPPATAERLRVAALSLHRVQRSLQLELPAHLVGQMLALSLSND